MSAYFVEYTVIDNILAGIAHAKYDQPHWISQHCLPISFRTWRRLGNKLLLLNARALKERYGDQIATMRKDICQYDYQTQLPPTIFQFYKSLSCLHYQCSEGNIPQTQLYQDIGKLLDQIAHQIVANHPKYQEAKW